MSVEILPVRRADLPAIDHFLKTEWDEWTGEPLAGPLRERNWLPGNDDFGLRLMVDGELAGYLGASYSERPIDGASRRFCAIAPWFVKEEHRRHSMAMLHKLLADKDVSFVNLTPTRPMSALFARLGFTRLDDVKLLCPPLLNLPFLRPWRSRLVADPAAVRSALAGGELRIFDDHVGTKSRHVAIVDGVRVCHVVAGRRLLRRVAFAELLHVSEPVLLEPQFERIVWILCRYFRAAGVAADARLLAGAQVKAIRYRLNSPPLFRSQHVSREKIDNLWSELAY